MQTWCEKIDCRNQVRSKLNMENINSWNDIKWTIVDQTVFRLQLRIYKAATEKKLEKMYKLQKTLVSSKFAKYAAVRKVTQDNTGKKTPGVDQKLITSPKASVNSTRTIAQAWSARFTAFPPSAIGAEPLSV